MSPKDKARELIEKLLPNVYCYLGSGMLTNEYSEEVALINAKKQALICVEEIICNILHGVNKYEWTLERRDSSDFILYWQEVKQEIENYESTNY